MTFKEVVIKNFKGNMRKYLSYFICSSFSIMIFFMYSTLVFNEKLNKSPSVEKGVREAAEGGVIAGYPVTDVAIRLYDGSFHEVDSNEMSFKMAGSMAFKEGIQRGAPVLQEPIMKVEVVAPEDYVGDVIGQMNARRGEILGMEIRPGKAQAVRAMVPLAEMFGYATELRSATQGRGVFTMEFDHYARVSENVARAIIGA